MTLDYIAGLVEGEGCFCLGVQRIKHRKGALRVKPIFVMYMTDKDLIEKVADTLRENGLSVYIQFRAKATSQGQWGIEANGISRAKAYCETFIPLLHGNKRRAAELVLEFCRLREAASRTGNQRGYKPYSERELDIVRDLRMVNGNRNGRKNPLPPVGTLRDCTTGAGINPAMRQSGLTAKA